ncbi:uncharacterized protein LOC109718073 [Ananas comosus]|uniref:Uncharacterized protein LOC109718073 n=1 Tax=Ananas comosus TaxID=4615 RepID=A0A6P5FTQ9_ANACO|nr:uncharacterized protein LOC109718073 [Ananas comosus]
MWRSQEWEERCRKHFEHKQSKGVCPYCLREKLIHLSASSSASTTANASSSSSSSPTDSSGCAASPPGEEPNFTNNSQQLFKENMVTKAEATKETTRSLSLDVKENKAEEKQGREEENMEKKEQKKKKRFWAKLLHSKTMKEKSSTKWMFY